MFLLRKVSFPFFVLPVLTVGIDIKPEERDDFLSSLQFLRPGFLTTCVFYDANVFALAIRRGNILANFIVVVLFVSRPPAITASTSSLCVACLAREEGAESNKMTAKSMGLFRCILFLKPFIL